MEEGEGLDGGADTEFQGLAGGGGGDRPLFVVFAEDALEREVVDGFPGFVDGFVEGGAAECAI